MNKYVCSGCEKLPSANCKKPKINKDGNSYYYPYRKVKIE